MKQEIQTSEKETTKETLVERARIGMEAKGMQPSSIRRILQTFGQLIEAVGVKEEYDADDVKVFLASKTRAGRSGTTIHNDFRFLKIIFERMSWPWQLTTKDLPKKNTPYQPFFNVDEALSLYLAADQVVHVGGRYGEMLKLRNRALVRLSAITMLRRGEIIRLDIGNYRRPHLRITNPEKNSEYTERLLDSETCDALDAYLKARRKAKCTALFTTGSGKRARRFSSSGLSLVMATIKKAAGIDKPGAGWHANRRGGLTIAHKKGGMSEKELAEYTGITPEIVKRYIQLDKTEVMESFEGSHPFFKQESFEEIPLEERERELRKALRGLSPEAQENILAMVRNQTPQGE